MKEEGFLLPIPKFNDSNEARVVAYLLVKSDDSVFIETAWFSNAALQAVAGAIQHLHRNKLVVDFDSVLATAKMLDPSVNATVGQLKELYDAGAAAPTNLAQAIEYLRLDHIKNKVNHTLVTELAALSLSRDPMDPKKMRSLVRTLGRNLDELEGLNQQYDLAKAMEDYDRMDADRRSGTRRRSFGFPELDEMSLSPAEGGDVTHMAGLPGSGKSTMLKNVEHARIEQQLPTLSFNTELRPLLNFDRLVAMRSNVSLDVVVGRWVGKPEEMERIHNAKEQLRANPYYIYNAEPTLTLDQVSSFIERGQEEFRRKGLLPSDGYLFVTVDLVTLLLDFAKGRPEDITVALQKICRMARLHNVHILTIGHANENRWRNRTMKKEEVEQFQLTVGDIYGGMAYEAYCRLVLLFHRPKDFRERVQRLTGIETAGTPDIAHVYAAKNTNGISGNVQFRYNATNCRVSIHVVGDVHSASEFKGGS